MAERAYLTAPLLFLLRPVYRLFLFGDAMKFDDEKELENLIIESHNKNGVCPVSDCGYDSFEQQANLKGYGTIDILGVSGINDYDGIYLSITIYELKNRNITEKDVSQISRYYRGFLKHLEDHYEINGFDSDGNGKGNNLNITVQGILVGSGYDGGDVCYLVDAIPWLSCYHFSIGINGVKFDLSGGWHSKNEADGRYIIGGIDIEDIIKYCGAVQDKENAEKELVNA